MKHIRLVRYVARSYQWALGPTLEQADLEQEGLLGVEHALKRFDPERGKFSTYAVPWIRHYIQRQVYAVCRTVRQPMAKAKAAYKRGSAISLTTVSLDAPPRIRGQEATGPTANSMLEQLGFTAEAEGPAAVEADEQRELVAHMMSTLGERERLVLQLRFFEDMTLFEVGRRLGITKERARQIQATALERIGGRIAREAAE